MKISKISVPPISKTPIIQDKLVRNTSIGTALGLGITTLALSKGNVKNIPKLSYDLAPTIALCTGTALGGVIGAELTDKGENRKGRLIELQNQLVFNDILPTLALTGVNKAIKTNNHILRLIALVGTLISSTFLGHKLSEIFMKKEGLEPKSHDKSKYFEMDAGNAIYPISATVAAKPVQKVIRAVTPLTFTSTSMNISLAKNSDYFKEQPCNKN